MSSMERLPNLSFVGDVSDKARKEKRKEYERFMIEDHRLRISQEEKEKLARHEVAKTPEEIRLFEFADSWGQKRQEICGATPYQFPVRNIFLLKPDGYNEMVGGSGATGYVDSQRIAMVIQDNKYNLTSKVFHEMTHCRGKIVVEIAERDQRVLGNTLRTGLTVHSTSTQNRRGESHKHLHGLEEAVVSQEEVYFSFALLDRPEFKELKRMMLSESGRAERERICDAKKLDNDDLLCFDPEKKEYEIVGYSKQRKVLRYVCQEIAEAVNSTENEVYFLFLKAHFSGHLLEIARLFEKTFGSGAFRRLGDMGTDSVSAVQTLEALKRMRAGMIGTRDK